MISNQILQSTVDGLKAIARTELAVCDIENFWLLHSRTVSIMKRW